MNGNIDSVTWMVIAIAFAVGYWIVSFLFRKFGQGAGNHKTGDERKDHATKMHLEDQLAETLGFNGPATKEEIKAAYHRQLAKYHPDKVHHLGSEFQKIADQKTREIVTAYKYFQKKYHIA
jgi:preprotein translocase subunit Sec63